MDGGWYHPRRGASVLISLFRLLLDVPATSRHEKVKLQAEVLVLLRQVQVLERQIKGFNGALRIE